MSIYGRTAQDRMKLGAIVAGSILTADTITCLPDNSGVAQVTTLSVLAPAFSVNYTIGFTHPSYPERVDITVATGGATTQAQFVALWTAAINEHPIVSGWFSAATSTFDSVWTARQKNVAITVTEILDAGSDMSLAATTAASAATAYDIARYVKLTTATTQPRNRRCALLTTLAGPVLTAVIGHGASGTYSQAYTLTPPPGAGQSYGVVVAWVAGADQTAADNNAEADYTAKFPTGTVVTNAVAGTVVVTLPPGWLVAEAGLETAATGGATLAVSIAAGSALPAVALVYDPSDQAPTSSAEVVATIRAGTAVPAIRGGALEVAVLDPSASITADGLVYIETLTGSTNGRCYTTPSATRFPHPTHRWVDGGFNDGYGVTLAVVRTA